MIHRGKEGETLKTARAAVRKMEPGEWMLVSSETAEELKREIRDITKGHPEAFGFEIFEVAGFRVISSPWVPVGGFWAARPILFGGER